MATRRWLGNAQAIKQVTTIAVTGTWATADTATLTINGKDLVVTIGSAATIADVVAAIVAAMNAADASDSLVGDESRNVGGQEIAEFTELVASGAASPITLTAATAGKPFVVSVGESTAGSGALGTPTAAVAATGPNFFSDAGNWSGGAVPVDGDAVVFDAGSVDCFYGLAQSSVTPASLTVTAGYSGRIGLPQRNEDNASATYNEYRDLYLALGESGDATNIAVSLGEGEGTGSGRLKLDFGDGQFTGNIFGSGQRAETGVPSILLKGTHASNVLNVVRGDVGVAPVAGETATLDVLRVSYVDNPTGDVQLTCGSGVTLDEIEIAGGDVRLESATTAIVQSAGELTLLAGAHALIEVDGGTCFYRSTGTLTQGRVGSDGEINCSRDMRSRTFTDLELHEGSSFVDPFQTVTHTNPIKLPRTGVEKLRRLELGDHYSIQRGAI